MFPVPVHHVIEVLFMNDADNIVDACFIHRQAGEAVHGKDVGNFLETCIDRNRHHFHARRQNVLDIQIIELDGGRNQIRFMFLKIPVLLRLINHCDQLIRNIRILVLNLEQLRRQILPALKHQSKRAEKNHDETHKAQRTNGETLRRLLGKGLRRNLTEQKYNQRNDNRRNRRPLCLSQPAGEQNRTQRSRKNINDIVSDENGCQKTIIIVQNLQNPAGAAVAIILHGFQADPGSTRICGFNRRKKAGKQNQDDERKNKHL